MAVTQYIGARYVPNFASPIEWNNTCTYDPLTIVTHQGNSYTSRQFVPQGVDIANDTFWALTGNYNAQVEQYRQEVRELDKFCNEIADHNVFVFENFSDMNQYELEDGWYAKTLGYYTPYDGGGANYKIVSGNPVLISDGTVVLEQLGVKKEADVSDVLQNALNNYQKVIVNGSGYKLYKPVRIPENTSLVCTKTLSYLDDNDDHYHFNWYGGSNDPMFTTVSGNGITSYVYDDYPKSGIEIKGVRINGKNKAAMGFLISAQRNTFIDRIAARGFVIGICVTRSWGIEIGQIESHYNQLGFSTVPAYSLSEKGIPVYIPEVKDAAVNNITIGNINMAQNDNGFYTNVMLQSTINCINSEEPTANGRYHMHLVNCGSFFTNVHIENTDESVNNENFVDINVVTAIYKIVPQFGYVQCNSIYSTNSFPIDTLLCYYRGNSTIAQKVKFLTEANNDTKKPFVHNFINWDYVNYNTREYLPKMRAPLTYIINNTSTSIPTAGNNKLQIVLYNSTDTDYNAGGTVTFAQQHGGSTIFNIPSIPSKTIKFFIVEVPYASTGYGKINITPNYGSENVVDMLIGYDLVAEIVDKRG